MSFILKILGANSATPAYGRHQTSQLLVIDQYHFLIDCGEGTQMRLNKFKAKASKIQHILISHLHGDHFFGLMGLLNTMSLGGRVTDLHVYAPPGLSEIITVHLKHSGTVLNYKTHFHALEHPEQSNRIFENELLTIDTLPLDHRIPCFGFIFKEKEKRRRINKAVMPADLSIAEINDLKDGRDILNETGILKYKNENFTLPPRKSRSYAYCSDTRFNESIVPLIQDVDLLYHEATFMKSEDQEAFSRYHSTTEHAAIIAKKANAKQLIIGHYSSRYQEIDDFLNETKAVFPKTLLAIEGNEYIVND